MGKAVLYLGYFTLYSIILLIIGKSSLHGSNTPEDYFICGRKVSLPLCVSTFTGTWVSAITILSLTGNVYEDGISALIYSVFPWFAGGFFLAAVAGRVWQSEAITIPEYFKLRFGGSDLQLLYGIVFVFVYLLYLVPQYKGFGMIASELFEIPYPLAVLLVYLFILYTTIGGYRSVIRTDFFNLLLLTVSLLLICSTLIGKAGGLSQLFRTVSGISGRAYPGAMHPTAEGQLLSLSNSRFGPLVSLSMFWGWGLGLAANPQYLIRVMSADSRRNARNTVLLSLLLLSVIYVSLTLIGLSMRALVPALTGESTTDGIFIRIMNNELYGPFSGLFFFSVIGACISTANSQLLLIASAVSYDIVGAAVNSPLSSRATVRFARITVLAAGTLAMLLALNPPAFTLSFGGDLWGVIGILVFPPLCASIYSSSITLDGVRACIAVGIVVIAVAYPLNYLGYLPAHPAMFGVPLSTVAMILRSRRTGGAA